jgi:hypothetical protein
VIGALGLHDHGAHLARGRRVPCIDPNALGQGNAVERVELRTPVMPQPPLNGFQARVGRR